MLHHNVHRFITTFGLLACLLLIFATGLQVPAGFISKRKPPMSEKVRMLQHFKHLNGHVKVPKGFIIPKATDKKEDANIWPKDYHGFRLGQMVYYLRKLGQKKVELDHPTEYKALNALDFCWEKSTVGNGWNITEKLEMMKCFKRIHGHVNIPKTFVIPSNDSSWPAKFANATLGSIKNKLILSHYVKHPEVHQAFLDLGLGGNNTHTYLKETKLMQIFQSYYQQYGNLSIHKSFVVSEQDSSLWPKGSNRCKLGRIASTMKSLGEEHYKDRYPRLYHVLNQMGFNWKSKMLRSVEERVNILRQHFHKHGHWDIRDITHLPSKATEQIKDYYGVHAYSAARGMRYTTEEYLKKHHPDYYQELDEMGFPWNKHTEIKIHKTLLPVATRYFELNGHLNVSYDFIVPNGTSLWSETQWGYKLGRKIGGMRSRGRKFYVQRNPRFVQALENMKFIWMLKPVKRFDYKKDLFEYCHNNYRNIDKMDSSFVVPENDTSSPAQFRGATAGKMLKRLKHQTTQGTLINKDKNQIAVLEKIGVPLRKTKLTTEQLWLPAIRKYCELYNNFEKMTRNYVTPVNDTNWPIELQNKSIGKFLQKLRIEGEQQCRNNHPQLYYTLEKYGFQWNGINKLLSFTEISMLLNKFFDINGHSKIAVDFAIPLEDKRWPKQYRGRHLGKIVKYLNHVKMMYQHPEEYQQLKTLGFLNVRAKSFPEQAMILKHYYSLHGHLNIKSHEVIAETDLSWPEHWRGYKLGLIIYPLTKLRNEKKRKFYPDICNELKKMGLNI